VLTFKPSASVLCLVVSGLFMGSTALLPVFGQQPKPPSEGEKLFRAQCSSCHGAHGEGAAGYPKPLIGSKSVDQLNAFIAKSMPPGPVHCSKAAAMKIAPYIFNAFYSPVAQARNRPPRVELSRLTVDQFRNSVTDLVGGFRPAIPSDPPGGLYGEYYKGRDMDQKSRVFKRIDPQVSFDFGRDGPTPNQFDPHFFSIAWQGSVLAPDTGEYEFVVRSDQDVRLWVNGWKHPLIDAFVRSANDKEFRATINLLGGRAYPIRLEFSKASQGVDDAAQKKGKPAPPASVSLLWTRPFHTTELIQPQFLFTQTVGESFVLTTKFPPDDRSMGFERGDSVSKEWDDATTSAAIETADYVAGNLSALTGVKDEDKDRPAKLRNYFKQFVQDAFRRPLSKEVEQLYVDKQFDAVADPAAAAKRVVMLALLSPRFLYPDYTEGTAAAHDDYAIASDLSFGLWDTSPDAQLEDLASKGALSSRSDVEAQADRMSRDPRAWNKLRKFLFWWLKLDEVPDIVKNGKEYPTFDASTVSDLRTSLELFLQNTAWSEASDYRELMTSPKDYMNGHLAEIYGAKLAANAGFEAVTIDNGTRCGVLTNPYVLTRYAYVDRSSPIHRGVLIVRNFLGRVLNPPPAAFAPLPASVHPEMTNREKISLQTKPTMCAACHGIINPIGFTLEEYDAVGRLQSEDKGRPVDCSGSYKTLGGSTVKFSDAHDLAEYLANSDESHTAFVEKLFQNMIKQPIAAYGPKALPTLVRSFADNRYSIRKLMSQIVLATLPGGIR